ncbi:MAG: ABC transporter permease [Flavobacteriia bacterium]|nr:MAG: ABC transporter permease [Flavobacteriia bacterium]
MKEVINIDYLSLIFGYIILIIPFYILWYYKTGLVKDAAISFIRMTVQLLLVGFYLEFIFDLNNTWLNLLWVFIMTILATFTIIKRSELKKEYFLIPIFISILLSIIITDTFFLGFIIKLPKMFDARYFIPITGMLLGNSIKTIIIALNVYYKKLKKEKELYKWYVANGATHQEAVAPFKKEALKVAFNPVIANVAIVGLISLPGMMTGQILGGSSPIIAVKYQIMLMITVFSSSIISVFFSIYFADKKVFDAFGNLKKIQN